MDALRFLEDSKASRCSLDLGKRVAVIGGGDVAMDCARVAKRNRGVDSVAIVYRRTREFMPSQYEEQELALADGVEFVELCAPLSFSEGVLGCEVMRLGDMDASGRRGVVGTGEKRKLYFDTVIGALGAGVDTELFGANGIALNSRGFPAVNGACESSLANVYVTGDCKAGAATVVKAIADGKAAAADILKKLSLEADFTTGEAGPGCLPAPDFADLYRKKGVIAEAKKNAAGSCVDSGADCCRCLSCNTLCEVCADVCPNRANVTVNVRGKRQIVHVDRMCNECGNCAAFCPHSGKPYKDKITVFESAEAFDDSENPGFLKTGPDSYRVRLEDKSVINCRGGAGEIPDQWATLIETVAGSYAYIL